MVVIHTRTGVSNAAPDASRRVERLTRVIRECRPSRRLEPVQAADVCNVVHRRNRSGCRRVVEERSERRDAIAGNF